MSCSDTQGLWQDQGFENYPLIVLSLGGGVVSSSIPPFPGREAYKYLLALVSIAHEPLGGKQVRLTLPLCAAASNSREIEPFFEPPARLNGMRFLTEQLRGDPLASETSISKLRRADLEVGLGELGLEIIGSEGTLMSGEDPSLDGGGWVKYARNWLEVGSGGDTLNIQRNIISECTTQRERARRWGERSRNVRVHLVSHAELIPESEKSVRGILEFLGRVPEERLIHSSAAVIDASLYRERNI